MYAEQVLGRAASPEQLDELFQLHAAAHPIVKHGQIEEVPDEAQSHLLGQPKCQIEILSHHPSFSFSGPPPQLLASGRAICSLEDQWCRRLGVTIAFGRALKQMRVEAGWATA
jgi:hypothetical protein